MAPEQTTTAVADLVTGTVYKDRLEAHNGVMNDELTPQTIKTPNATQLLAMTDDDLATWQREITKQTIAHLHEYTAPCTHEYADGEPHGMHSDDGHDYLQAILDLTLELLDLDPADPQFRTWITEKNDPESDRHWENYACDGIPNIYYDIFTRTDD